MANSLRSKRLFTPNSENLPPQIEHQTAPPLLDKPASGEILVTPQTKRQCITNKTPRASSIASRVRSQRARKWSLGQPRSSTEYAGIPPNASSNTILIRESVPPSAPTPDARPVPSTYFTRRRQSKPPPAKNSTDLQLSRLSRSAFLSACPSQSRLRTEFNDQMFKDWKDYIDLRFNVLVYGMGSKAELIDTFGSSDQTKDGAVIVFDAYKGSVSAKKILSEISKLFGIDHKEQSADKVVEGIKADGRRAYVLINGIDSSGLRGREDQLALSKIACCDNVAIVASMDNVNGGLLWSVEMANMFKWTFFAVNTCQHYYKETVDWPIITNPTKRSKAIDTTDADLAMKILRSLVSSAQQTFVILANQKIRPTSTATPLKLSCRSNGNQRKSNPLSQGLSFDLLFKKCKEKFLVSSKSSLKCHIRDLMIHDLIVRQNGKDGEEIYLANLDNDDLDLVLKKLNKREL